MANPVPVNFPSMPAETFVDNSKLVTPVWGRFLHDLWMRTGGNIDLINGSGTLRDLTFTCDAAVVVTDALYIQGDGTLGKADASNINTAKVVGFCSKKINSITCNLRFAGELSGFAGLSIGSYYFLDTTSGLITVNAVINPNEVISGVGKARSNDTLVIELMNTYYIRS